MATPSLARACAAATFAACSAAHPQVDLKFPATPERQVQLPGGGPVYGARLYAPEGAGPFPAVLLSHTCGGQRRHLYEWAQRLLAAGYVVLMPDHIEPRGVKNNCAPHFTVSVTDYAKDAVAGLRHLRALGTVDAKRVYHVGFSYGAQAGLRLASAGFRDKEVGGERFAAVVSVYPWCNHRPTRDFWDHQWNFHGDTDVPLLVVLGADDDEADPSSCIRQARSNAAKGLPVEHHVLPGTTHGFDHSLLGDKPHIAQQGNRTVTYRYNARAVEESWRLMREFLARHRLP